MTITPEELKEWLYRDGTSKYPMETVDLYFGRIQRLLEELEYVQKSKDLLNIHAAAMTRELVDVRSRADRIAQEYLRQMEYQIGEAARDKRCANSSPEEESLDLVEIALRRKERAEKAERFLKLIISEHAKNHGAICMLNLRLVDECRHDCAACWTEAAEKGIEE